MTKICGFSAYSAQFCGKFYYDLFPAELRRIQVLELKFILLGKKSTNFQNFFPADPADEGADKFADRFYLFIKLHYIDYMLISEFMFSQL